jgi:hypothetical protein
MSDTPRMKSKKEMYEDMLVEPTRISSTHTSKPMDLASKMFGGEKDKKMAKGGYVTSADGCITKGHTRGRMI